MQYQYNPMKKITIIIIDDHTLIRQTWSFVLNNDLRFLVVAESGSAEEGIELCKKYRPDIVMLDISLPGMNGIEAALMIRKFAPATKIIGVSLHSQPSYAKKMMNNGASGYVTKNSSRGEMTTALLEVYSGKNFICSEIKNIMTEEMMNTENPQQKIHSLSVREVEITKMISQGLSSKEIASLLFLSIKTVEVHRYNILKKLGLRNAAALVNYINHNNLIRVNY